MTVKQFAKQLTNNSKNFNEVLSICKDLLNTPIAAAEKQYLDSRVSKYNQEKFEFGYFPMDQDLHLLTSKIDREKLISLKFYFYERVADGHSIVVVDKGSMLNDHNLIMPFKDINNNIVALIGRSLNPGPGIPKYKSTIFMKNIQLFGLNHAKNSIIKKDHVFIVEGQIDCISAHEMGWHNVVALGGTTLSSYQAALIMRYTKNITLILDNDKAGRLGAKKIINMYGSLLNIENKEIPSGYKDVDGYLKNNVSGSLLSL